MNNPFKNIGNSFKNTLLTGAVVAGLAIPNESHSQEPTIKKEIKPSTFIFSQETKRQEAIARLDQLKSKTSKTQSDLDEISLTEEFISLMNEQELMEKTLSNNKKPL